MGAEQGQGLHAMPTMSTSQATSARKSVNQRNRQLWSVETTPLQLASDPLGNWRIWSAQCDQERRVEPTNKEGQKCTIAETEEREEGDEWKPLARTPAPHLAAR